MNHCIFLLLHDSFPKFTEDSEGKRFQTRLTAALWCLAHTVKYRFSCAALVIQWTEANVLKKSKISKHQLGHKLWDGLKCKTGRNDTSRLSCGILNTLSQHRFLNLRASLHDNYSITNFLSTSEQTHIDSFNHGKWNNEVQTSQPQGLLKRKIKQGERISLPIAVWQFVFLSYILSE